MRIVKQSLGIGGRKGINVVGTVVQNHAIAARWIFMAAFLDVHASLQGFGYAWRFWPRS